MWNATYACRDLAPGTGNMSGGGGGGGGSPCSRREVCLVHRSSGLRLPAGEFREYSTQAIVVLTLHLSWRRERHPISRTSCVTGTCCTMLIIQVLDLFKINSSQSGLVCMHTKYATYFCSAALNNGKKRALVIWWAWSAFVSCRLLALDENTPRDNKLYCSRVSEATSASFLQGSSFVARIAKEMNALYVG